MPTFMPIWAEAREVDGVVRARCSVHLFRHVVGESQVRLCGHAYRELPGHRSTRWRISRAFGSGGSASPCSGRAAGTSSVGGRCCEGDHQPAQCRVNTRHITTVSIVLRRANLGSLPPASSRQGVTNPFHDEFTGRKPHRRLMKGVVVDLVRRGDER